MSFWIGNVLLVILNVPMIGLWVRLLTIPYHLLFNQHYVIYRYHTGKYSCCPWHLWLHVITCMDSM